MEHGCPLTVGRTAGELERDDRKTSDVVDAIPRFPARDHTGCVLDDPDVVDQCPQMIRSDRRKLELDDGYRLSPRPGCRRLLQHDCRFGSDRWPGEIGPDPPRLRACGSKGFGLSMKSQTAFSIAATSSNGTSVPAPVASMSFAKRYGVETAAQPAARAKVNAPDAI